MRKTLSTVLLGLGLLSPACKKHDGTSAPGVIVERGAYATAPAAEATGGGAAAAGSAAAPTATAAAHGPSGVRAGEWDDNANYRDYVRWLADAPRELARLDVADRQFIVVEDRDGKPVPNCPVAITGGQGSTSLVTMASGRAIVFPRAMGLAGGSIRATATCAHATASASLVTTQLDNVLRLKLDQPRDLPARRTVDLAFVLDTTGSMGEEIAAVKTTIQSVATTLATDQTDVRIGLVEYKDRTDPEVTRTYPFSADLQTFSASVARLSAGGGGDMPEDMHAGLAAALDKLEWRATAVARMIVVIADAPPHLDYTDERDFADAARRAASRGIKLYTVSASGMDQVGQLVMRQLAQFTGASNMFVLRGGAGPDSVGGGDPASACGGTHASYASGKLDRLILDKLAAELAAVDGDPLAIAGRGQDENAKPCDQRLVRAM